MERYRVTIETPARQDLRDIFKYIAETLREPQTAYRLLGRIRKAIEDLDHMPERFPLYELEPWCSRGIRRLNIENFSAFYLVTKDSLTVSVLTVIYSGRNIDKILDKAIGD